MTKAMKTYAPALLCLAVMGLAACGGGGGGSTSGSDLSPTGGSAAPAPTMPSALAGASNGCFDLDAAFTPGNKSKISYALQSSGALSGASASVTVEETAIGNVPLDGQTVFRSGTKTTSQVPAPIATTSTGEISSYEIRTGLASLRQLRTESIGTLTGGGNPSPVQTQTITNYNPAPVNTTGELALGASVELVDKGTRSVTISPGPTTNEVFDDVQVWKFAAISTITVPAGTYETCVFELFEKNTPAVVNKFWILRGRGLLVQSSSSDSQSTTLMQATSIELNGKTL